jgi:hypothetical protein
VLLSAATTTVISAVSAAAALATVLAYLYGLRRADQTAARDEALALAETRGQMLTELRRRVAALEHSQKQARSYYKGRIRELEATVEQTRREAREQAYQVQRLWVLAVAETLARLRNELEKRPPDVEAALACIRELLGDEELRSTAE